MKISVIFEALTGKFETDSKRATKSMEKDFKRLQSEAKAAGAAIGVAIVAGATIAAVAIKAAIDQADQLNEISQKIGIPTDVLSGLNYAAKLAGVATEELQAGLVKMVKFQVEAAKGAKEPAAAFEQLGIKLKDANGNLRDSAAVFSDFSDVFASFADGPEKTALALAVFGKAGAELIPLLDGGSQGIRDYSAELDKLGGTVSPAAAAAADAFNDNLDKLKTAAGGLALQVAQELLPDLIQLTDNFLALIKEGDGVSGTAKDIADGFRILGIAVQVVVGVFQGLVDTAQATVDALIGVGLARSATFKFMTGDVAGAKEDFAQAQRQMLAIKDDFAETARNLGLGDTAKEIAGGAVARAGSKARGGKGMGFKAPKAPNLSFLTAPSSPSAKAAKTGLSDAEKEAKALEDGYLRLNAQMAETIALFGQTTEVAKVRYDLEHGDLAKLSEEKKGQLLDQAATLDQLEKEKVLLDERNKAEEAKLKLHEEAQASVKQLLEDMQFELDLAGKTNAERIAANELRRIGIGLTDEEIAAAAKSIEAKAQELEAQHQLTDALDEFRQGFANNLTDVLTGAKSIGDAFKDLADMVINQIARMIAQQWTDKLFGAAGSTDTGSSGGFLSSLLGAFLPKHAGGTDYSLGGLAWVGERGKELVNLPRGSQVIPNHMLDKSGGRSQSNTFNITVPHGTSRQTAQQMAQEVTQALAMAERVN